MRLRFLLVCVLALLVGDAAAGLAGRLAGSLALAAAAVAGTVTQVAGLQGFDSLHNTGLHFCPLPHGAVENDLIGFNVTYFHEIVKETPQASLGKPPKISGWICDNCLNQTAGCICLFAQIVPLDNCTKSDYNLLSITVRFRTIKEEL